MDYSELLTYLFDITGLKLKDISSLLHYDVSYISKWINGHNIPSISQSRDINETLCEKLTEIIFKRNLQDKLKGLYHASFDLTSYIILRKVIFNLLNMSFYKSYEKSFDNSILPTEESLIIPEKDNIIEFLYHFFSVPIEDNDIELYSTINLDFLIYLFKEFENLHLFTARPSIKINILTNYGDDYFKFEDFSDAFITLAEFSYYDMNVYRYTKDTYKYSQFVYIKNQFAIFFSMDTNNRPIIASFTQNPDTLNSMNDIVDEIFSSSLNIFRTIQDDIFEEYFYKNTLYSSNRFNFFISNFQGFFLNESLLKKILARNNVSSDEAKHIINIRKLQTHMLKKMNLNLIVNSIPYFKSIVNKKLSIGSFIFDLTDEEIKAYLKLLKKNYDLLNGQKFYRINFSNLKYDYNINCALTNEAFFSKRPDNLNPNKFKYLVADNNRFTKILNKSFSRLSSTTDFEETTNSEIYNTVESYLKALNILK